MEEKIAIRALACLGHPVRIRVFRDLIAAGANGDLPGDIAKRLGVPPSSLSFHLNQLEQAGLTFSWRVGRTLRYAVDLHALRGLLAFLIEDCCRGDPAICGVLPAPTGPAPSPSGDNAMSDDQRFSVLFLCTGNSARSIMAECILNRLGQGRFTAYSAGSHPKGAIHPAALELLKKNNFPTTGLRSKGWEEFAGEGAPEMDFVFTVCDQAAGEVCPIWPGQPMTAHWGVPDPAAATGTDVEKHLAFADAMRFLQNRISIFVSLPMHSLDRLALQRRLDEIGAARPKETQGAA